MNDLLTIVSEIERLSKNVSSWHEFAVYARNNAGTLVEQVRALSEALVALADGAEICHEAGVCQPFVGIYKVHGELIESVRAALLDKGATS